MSDTETNIEPALTDEEWAKGIPGVFGWDDGSVFIDWRPPEDHEPSVDRPHAVIAALNAALKDDDKRKITRETVRALRNWIAPCNNHAGFRTLAVLLHHHADALASYLPPE